MAANLKHVFKYYKFSRQFSKYFLYKYIGNHCRSAAGRSFSVLALQRGALLTGIPSCSATNLPVRLRIFHVGFRSAATVKSKEYDDPEFVTEEFSLASENLKDGDDMIKNIKEKTGVIMKVFGKKDGENGTKILIGGTQQEVRKALFYLKSSANQDSSSQRLILLQDDEIRQHSLKEKPIWAYYRRNFKGQKPPMKTRKKCIRGKGEKQVVSGNPCPICRLYLAGGYKLDYKDVDLLSQFMSPHTGEVFEASKTGVCRYQQEHLLTAIQTAKDCGLLPYSVPGPRSIEVPAEHAQIPVNVRLK